MIDDRERPTDAGAASSIVAAPDRHTGVRLLALVGGNARYVGIADLCGIGSSDARDSVVARFAVVRRERLATGLV